MQVKGFQGNYRCQNILHWGKILSITGVSQIFVQALAFISGILVLRILPSDQYAFYTLANTMLGTMTILADGGIAAGVMTAGGKVWTDRNKLGSVLVTGMKLRQKFAVGSLAIAVPIIVYLLTYHDADSLTIVLIVLSLIPAFFSTLSGTLYEIAPKLKQDILPIQRLQVFTNAGRLLLLSITLFIFPWVFIAILAGGVPQIWNNRKLKKLSEVYADWKAPVNKDIEKEILSIVKKVLPSAIYYCISGQITIWMISLFGSTSALSQIGALGRLSIGFTVFSTMFMTIVTPRFSRMKEDRQHIVHTFLKIQIGLILLATFLIAIFYVYPEPFLFVLGPRFENLKFELFLMAISGSLGFMNSSTNGLLSSRGLIVPPHIFIPFAVCIQLILAFLLNVGEMVGVLQYSIYTSLCIYLLRIVFFYKKYNNR